MHRPITRPPASREVDKWDEFERAIGQMDKDDEEMKQEVHRDPWTIVAVAVNIVATLGAVLWYAGKNDERLGSVEKQVQVLQVKSEKDAVQDTQIAVLSTQLGQIQSTVSEIKAAVSREKK